MIPTEVVFENPETARAAPTEAPKREVIATSVGKTDARNHEQGRDRETAYRVVSQTTNVTSRCQRITPVNSKALPSGQCSVTRPQLGLAET